MEETIAMERVVLRHLQDVPVRRYALVFDDPVSLCIEENIVRYGEKGAIEKDKSTANSPNTAPCSFSDDRPESVLLEIVGELIAVRSCGCVGDADLRTGKKTIGERLYPSIAVEKASLQGATQPFQDPLTCISAAVPTDINNESLFVCLRVELAQELLRPAVAKVREINVADSPI